MKIIVGIGNPGKKYAETRHNIGFTVVEALARRHRLDSWRRRFHALAAEGPVGGRKALLVKPETYVNESGRAVREAAQWCRASFHDIMVVCDDFNLSLGQLRVRGGGSSGGHKGVQSIIDCLHTEDVPRLRIGIASAAPERANDRDFVLSRFTDDEWEVMGEAVERSARALEAWLESGLERCQNEFNTRPKPKEKEEEADA